MTAIKTPAPNKFGYAEVSSNKPGIQTVTFNEAELVRGVKVRYRISHDRSYARQSYAVAEVWSPRDLRWNEAATYDSSQWAGDTEVRGHFTAGGNIALLVLKSRVRELLV